MTNGKVHHPVKKVPKKKNAKAKMAVTNKKPGQRFVEAARRAAVS